jgi:Rod binding domain-containing protein
MSSQDAGSVSAAMATGRLTEPAWVSDGSAKVQREYALGLEFERLLVTQLATSMTASAEPSGESAQAEGGGDAASSVLSSMIPGALADGVVAGGGLGLAAQLTRQIEGAGPPHPPGVGTPPDGRARTPDAPAGTAGGVEADVTGGSRA